MDDPVSLAWTFLLSFILSSLTVSPLLTASRLSPKTILPLFPLHTGPGPFEMLLPLLGMGNGAQVSGIVLSVTPLNHWSCGHLGQNRPQTGDIVPNHFLPPPLLSPRLPPAGEPESLRTYASCTCCPLAIECGQSWGMRGRRSG